MKGGHWSVLQSFFCKTSFSLKLQISSRSIYSISWIQKQNATLEMKITRTVVNQCESWLYYNVWIYWLKPVFVFFFPHAFSETALFIMQDWNILYSLLSSSFIHFGNFDLGVPDYFMVFDKFFFSLKETMISNPILLFSAVLPQTHFQWLTRKGSYESAPSFILNANPSSL